MSSLKKLPPGKMAELGLPQRLQLEIQDRLFGKAPAAAPPKVQAAPEPAIAPTMATAVLPMEWNVLLSKLTEELSESAEIMKCLNILHTVTTNLLTYPTEGKYRKIKLAAPAMSATIGKSASARQFLSKLGFEEKEGELTLSEYNYSWPKLSDALAAVDSAIAQRLRTFACPHSGSQGGVRV